MKKDLSNNITTMSGRHRNDRNKTRNIISGQGYYRRRRRPLVEYFHHVFKSNVRTCTYALLVVSITLIINSNIELHSRFSSLIPDDLIVWESIHSAHQSQRRSLSVAVRVRGGLGNHLCTLSMGVIVQSIARRHGIKTSLHITSQDADNLVGYESLYYKDEFRTLYEQKCKRCFPNLRNLLFFEGNEENFKEYSRKHDNALGPELSSQVLIERYSRRESNYIVASIEKALETVQEVWQLDEIHLESGKWNSSFTKNDTVLGPYSFPMITTTQSPDWNLYGRFYDDLMNFFQVDEDCFKVRAYPDEVVFHYRDLAKLKTADRPWYDDISFHSTATNLLGHLKGGDKLAIVVNERKVVKPLIKKMRARNITVRVIYSKDLLDDFFFLLSAQQELIGRGESTFVQWAALLNRQVQKARMYFVDNGSNASGFYLPADFPPIMENIELQERLQFQLFKI